LRLRSVDIRSTISGLDRVEPPLQDRNPLALALGLCVGLLQLVQQEHVQRLVIAILALRRSVRSLGVAQAKRTTPAPRAGWFGGCQTAEPGMLRVGFGSSNERPRKGKLFSREDFRVADS